MVCADPYSIKPVKEVNQDSGCSDCMRRCDSYKSFVSHISMSFNKIILKSDGISHTAHHIWYN